MYIWEKQQTLIEAMPNLIRRNCWQKCYNCVLPWSENESKYVNMIKTEDGIRYICDCCTEEIKSRN